MLLITPADHTSRQRRPRSWLQQPDTTRPQRRQQELWAGKVYVPPSAPAAPLCWRQRYAASLQDAARTRLEQEELCAFRWTFRCLTLID